MWITISYTTPDQIYFCMLLIFFKKKTNYKTIKAWYLIHAGQVSNKQLQTFLEAILPCLIIRKLKHMLDVSLDGHKCVLFIQGFLWSHNL